MPDPMAYKYEAILRSTKEWADMGPYERAQLKAARVWRAQQDYSTPAPPAPSVPEPTVNYQPMSRYERGSARQRARLGAPIFHVPITTTCRKSGSESCVENTQPETSTEITDSESVNSPESIVSKPTSESTSDTPSKSPETPSTLGDHSEDGTSNPKTDLSTPSGGEAVNSPEVSATSKDQNMLGSQNPPDAQQVVPSPTANSAVKRKRTTSESCSTSNKRPAQIQLQSDDMIASNSNLQQLLLNVPQQTGDKNRPIILDGTPVPPKSGNMNSPITLDEVEVPQSLLPNVSQDPKSTSSTASNVISQATNQNPGANPPKKRAQVAERRLPLALSEIAMGFTSNSNPLQAFNRARRVPGNDIQPVLQQVEHTITDSDSCPYDLPHHVWIQARDLVSPIQESLSKTWGKQKTFPDPIDFTSRLFNIPELQWLTKKANEGLVRGRRHGIPIDDLTYEFRQRYCWSFEPNLGFKINNILCKLQKTPDYFQSSQAPEKSPFFEGTRWQTVYLQVYLENGQSIGHKYSLDTSERWKHSAND